MKPVSAVDGSNYHLLGNQLRGESHSSRMARVYRNNQNHTPSLQPLGALTDFSNELGGPLLMAGLAGAIVGAFTAGDYPNKARGKMGAGIGAGIGFITAGVFTAMNPEFNTGQGDDVGQLIGLLAFGALAGSLGHGVSRRTLASR